MSYDIQIGDMNRNMTSNVAPMWDKALPHLNLRDMAGKSGRRCLPHLKVGVAHMIKNRYDYTLIEPKNDWGNYGSALEVLVELMFACENYPDNTVQIWR